jgi:hypothetical protein
MSETMVSPTSSTIVYNGRAVANAPTLSQYEQRLRVLELYVQLLIARTSMGEYWPEGLQEVASLLASLPLPKDEFSLVRRHLQNAVVYCQQEEFGAAAFELRALRGHLERF